MAKQNKIIFRHNARVRDSPLGKMTEHRTGA